MDRHPPQNEPDTGPIAAVPPARRRWIVPVVALAVLLVVVVVTVIVVVRSGSGGPTAGPTRPVTPPPDGRGTDLPITVEGNRILRDGQPWWLVGYNSFVWSGNCGTDEEQMSAEEVEEWFASMRHDGRGAVRLFFFEGWDLDRLDAAVESARRHDIYLTITLDDALPNCGEVKKDAAWFDDQGERDAYRDHMTMLMERYRGETTIAWFEFFNEPNFADGSLREFYDEMGAIADGVDPDRLFASGTIAPYAVGDDDDFLRLHESPGVDIASLHEYDEGEVESNHGPDAREQSAGKPVIVGEFGINASESGEDCDRDFAERAEQFGAKLEAYTTIEGYAGALAWAWQPGAEGDCVIGNLDVDELSQDVLRDFIP